MSERIKERLGKCGECKYFRESESIRKQIAPYHGDGYCANMKRTGQRKTPYPVFSMSAACFDAEDSDGQVTLPDLLGYSV